MRTTLTAPLPNGASVRSTSTVVTSPGFLCIESPDKKTAVVLSAESMSAPMMA